MTWILVSIENLFSQEQTKPITLLSPDQKTEVQILMKERLYYSVICDGKYALLPSPLSMTINDNQSLAVNATIIKSTRNEINSTITNVIGTRSTIIDHCNELTLEMTGNYSLRFRVYNDAVAYRFITNFPGNIKIINEQVEYRVEGWPKGWFSNDNSFETSFSYKQIEHLDNSKNLYPPCIIETLSGVKIAILESDVQDYPFMLLRKSNDLENRLISSFAKYPVKVEPGGFNNYILDVKERGDYIAVTSGKREFPWRVMIVAKNDKSLADNDIVYKLATPCKLTETAWIKPGKVSWDWWYDYALEGVDFKSGINTPTYLYHIDFAQQHGIEYIIVDWKWSDKSDLTLVNPDVDIQKIINYGKEKGVRVILWCPSFTLNRQLDKVLDLFASWGVAGVKVDFFDRWDQLADQMYKNIAEGAAKRKMLVDFHGCGLPYGFNRTYPNVINFEGVLGNEVNKWTNSITPKHKVTLAFTRLLAGPMDFTPGGMRNTVSGFIGRNTLPMVQGTRCAEMALYVIYNEPLVMLCDAPTVYNKEPLIIDFLSKIPTFWDESQVLDAKVGDYLVVARKKGTDWYIGAITDSIAREFNITLSFLGDENYAADIFKDGVNSDKSGTDYNYEEKTVTNTTALHLDLSSGGGAIVKLTPIK